MDPPESMKGGFGNPFSSDQKLMYGDKQTNGGGGENGDPSRKVWSQMLQNGQKCWLLCNKRFLTDQITVPVPSQLQEKAVYALWGSGQF